MSIKDDMDQAESGKDAVHPMKPFFGSSLSDLEFYCEELGVPRVHARSLMRSVYKDMVFSPWTEGLLPHRLKTDMPERYGWLSSAVQSSFVSRYDDSVKFLVRLHDSEKIEMVLMPEKKRMTLCISTQAGCRQACAFCRTGTIGFIRDLGADEIVEQVVHADLWLRDNPQWLVANRLPQQTRVTNVVLMGMGEPLDNVHNVMKAMSILSEPYGPHIALRRLSISTAGHLDGLKILLSQYPKAAIALSLHETNDARRSALMPINRRFPIAEVMAFLGSHYASRTKASLLVQYVVIEGVNDSLEHAKEMIDLLRGYPVKVNLIPLNEVDDQSFAAPKPARLLHMRDLLHQAGIRVMVRYSKGQDIGAACGQLVGEEG